MIEYFLRLVMGFQAFICLGNGTSFANSRKDVDIILPDLSIVGYAIPIESIVIGVVLCVLIYLVIKYNTRLLSRERFKIAINMLHALQTPLIVLRNHLEDLKCNSNPETNFFKINEALELAECVMSCNQSVITLDKANGKMMTETPNNDLELSDFISTIVLQCRPYANSRQIKLSYNQSADYISCRINKSIMTAALQHLLNKIIITTLPGSSINIRVSHTKNSWELEISNCDTSGKRVEKMFPFVPAIFPIHGYSDIWTIRKIVRLHGGKITGYGYGKTVCYHIVVPIDNQSHQQIGSDIQQPDKDATVKESSVLHKHDHNSGIEETYCILLVMSDTLLSEYLKKSLSSYFLISVLDNPDKLVETCILHTPDVIVIDEKVNGVKGDELCSHIKSDKAIEKIPVVLLVSSGDSESYLSHVECGADRLEMRTENISKLRANLRMLIDSTTLLRKRMKQFMSDAVSAIEPVDIRREDADWVLINKVNMYLEKNLSKDGYTVEMLSSDMGMSRTTFYTRIKEITGKPPTEYMYSFKMEMALKLLESHKFKITEIADMLGYCDAKYFGKKFKDFYHICPTKYMKNIAE